MERHRRIFKRLLIAYPYEYRREYEEPMTQLFIDRLRDEGGGARTLLVWAQMLTDLVKSAFAERMETIMKSFRTDWWRLLALPLSLFIGFVGLGLPFEPQTTAGDNWRAGAIAYSVATTIGLGLVIAGLTLRNRNRSLGSTMIAVGVMPGYPMAIFFWFPPVALVGLLSVAISFKAFLDAPKAPQNLTQTGTADTST